MSDHGLKACTRMFTHVLRPVLRAPRRRHRQPVHPPRQLAEDLGPAQARVDDVDHDVLGSGQLCDLASEEDADELCELVPARVVDRVLVVQVGEEGARGGADKVEHGVRCV